MKLNALSLLLICIVFSSCNNHFFNAPQPVDAKNSYTIPNKYRGTWFIDENKKNTLTIGKDFYKTNYKLQMKESKANFDSDTNSYFIGDKAYISEFGALKNECTYVIEGDSVVMETNDVTVVELGQSAFLRKFAYGFILNIEHAEMNGWWNIRFIDTRNKEGLLIREINDADLKDNEEHEILHEDFSEYIIARWSKRDIQNFIDNGGFSDTLFALNYKDRIKK